MRLSTLLLITTPLLTGATRAQVALDQSFGTAGITTTPIGNGVDWAKAIALQPDGRVLLGGFAGNDMALVRYTAEGLLDADFGDQGKIVTAFSGPSDVRAIAVQPDGRILVAGLVTVPGPTGNPGHFAVLRYLSDGTPDPSFGTGGRVTTLIGTSCLPYAMALLADGRILVGGNDDQGFAAARYLSDGTLDTSFGTGGKVTTVLGPYGAEADAIAVLPDGRFVLGGASTIYHASSDVNSEDVALVRYRTDGTLDPSFGTNGIVTYDRAATTCNEHARALALQPDGRLVVTGISMSASPMNAITLRFLADGAIDGTFGTGGASLTNLGSSIMESRGIALQPDGKILLVGYTYSDIALVRYTPEGTLDPTFDGDGRMVTDIGNSYDYGTAIALGPDGDFVVSAYTSYLCADRDFAVARYTNDISTAVAERPAAQPDLSVRYNGAPGIIRLEALLDASARVGLRVVDVSGKAVLVQDLGIRNAGAFAQQLDLSALSAGVYTLFLTGTGTRGAKIIVP